MLKCQTCGFEIPQNARACPNCGTLQGDAHYGPTAVSASQLDQATHRYAAQADELTAPSASQPKPGTNYGTHPYGSVSAANPYSVGNPSSHPYADADTPSNPYSTGDVSSNPYRTDVPPPPPGTPRQRNLALIIGSGLLVLVLLAGGVLLAVLHPWSNQSANTASTTPTNTTPNIAATAPATTVVGTRLSPTQALALYNSTISQKPVLDDPLTGPDNFGWNTGTAYATDHTSCGFKAGAYHSTATNGYFGPCYAKATNFSNFVFQAQITFISGHSGGLVFRADSTNDKAYQFRISNDGTYILNKFTLDSSNQAKSDTLVSGSKPESISTTQPNQLAVLVQGNYIYLFANGKYIDSASDSLYQSGQIGVYTDSDAGSVEASFSNAKVWKL